MDTWNKLPKYVTYGNINKHQSEVQNYLLQEHLKIPSFNYKYVQQNHDKNNMGKGSGWGYPKGECEIRFLRNICSEGGGYVKVLVGGGGM